MHVGSTHREDLEEIAQRSSQPFAIASISKQLNERRSLRGTVYFSEIGKVIDNIVRNYPRMRWWMTKGGLVVDVVFPEAAPLAEFDREAGKLTCESTVNGKVSAEAILEIAAFPSQYRAASLFQRAFYTALSALEGVHASFGNDAHVSVFARDWGYVGTAVTGPYVTDWTGSPTKMTSTVIAKTMEDPH